MEISGRPCLVTGASAGIGRAVAVELARRGGRIAILARRPAEIEETAALVRSVGADALSVPADVTDPTALRAAVDAAAATLGGLSIAVVNAGFGAYGAAAEVPDADVRSVIDVNLAGAIATARAALPHLRRAPQAALVGVGSVMGLIPVRGGGTYGATKAGFIFYLRALRLELADSNVRVGCVSPGAVRTEMFADVIASGRLPRLSRWLIPVLPPERVARAVARVVRRGGGETVIPATAAFFAAFARHFPRLAERTLLVSGAGEI